MRGFGSLQFLGLEAAPYIPVGFVCSHCDERIAPTDAGVYLENAVVHEECFVRMIWGSVGHQRGLCACPGNPGTLEDPPGLPVREAARAALREAQDGLYAAHLRRTGRRSG